MAATLVVIVIVIIIITIIIIIIISVVVIASSVSIIIGRAAAAAAPTPPSRLGCEPQARAAPPRTRLVRCEGVGGWWSCSSAWRGGEQQQSEVMRGPPTTQP